MSYLEVVLVLYYVLKPEFQSLVWELMDLFNVDLEIVSEEMYIKYARLVPSTQSWNRLTIYFLFMYKTHNSSVAKHIGAFVYLILAV